MLFRLFNRYSPALGDRLEAALLAIYREDDPADLIALTEEVLSPHGGRLLVGYEE
jgi:hypothetical protein